MIPPSKQWAIQIDVTNRCSRACSNCTRSLAHVTDPFDMSVGEFERALDALKDFPSKSEASAQNGGVKVVGVIGGEPVMHPQFNTLVDLMTEHIPARENRGLWTTQLIDAEQRAKFGYINFNPHSPPSRHHPILVAIKDVITDFSRMWRCIDQCPYQTTWSSSITPKGFFFCEVAAALDMVFQGPGGLPVEPGVWQEPLGAFSGQMERWCPRCSGAIPLSKDRARPDNEKWDDISESNLKELRAIGSPRVASGRYTVFDASGYSMCQEAGNNPLDYMGLNKVRKKRGLASSSGDQKIMLASETFARHMTNEGWQLQSGLEQAGYHLWGRYYPNDEVDVKTILDRTSPHTVIVQDKREWDPGRSGCFDKTVGFTHTSVLADRPDIFKVTICKDAHADPLYHEQAHDEIGCHASIIYYHPDIVLHLAPWLRKEVLIRTYHSLDVDELPHTFPGKSSKDAVLSGALDPAWTRPDFNGGVYQLRNRLARDVVKGHCPHIDMLPHPGYHAKGSATPSFLETLSQYKVSICTASIFGYALRKIIESTACGNVVITDLPRKDVLPAIDGNLHRIPSGSTAREVADLARALASDYDSDKQREWAMAARAFYWYPHLYATLSANIDTARKLYVNE